MNMQKWKIGIFTVIIIILAGTYFLVSSNAYSKPDYSVVKNIDILETLDLTASADKEELNEVKITKIEKGTIDKEDIEEEIIEEKNEETEEIKENPIEKEEKTTEITITEEKETEESDNKEKILKEVEENVLVVEETEVKELKCSISISCITVLDNMELLDPEKLEVIPQNGIIMGTIYVTYNEGDTVFDILQRETRANKIHLEFVNTPGYKSAYVEGINNLYEFDAGDISGWTYKVNGVFPSYGSSLYNIEDGDVIEWVYTCDLGRDVGKR